MDSRAAHEVNGDLRRRFDASSISTGANKMIWAGVMQSKRQPGWERTEGRSSMVRRLIRCGLWDMIRSLDSAAT